MHGLHKTIGISTLLVVCGTVAGQQKDTAYLKTKVDPGRAGVFVDGKYIGPARNFGMARKYALPAGQHQVKLVEPRYEEVSTTVDLQAGKTTDLSQTMKALPPATGPFGMIHTSCPDKFAAVYVNDRFYGHAGEFNNSMQALLLPPGEYRVRIEPVSGGTPVNQTIKLEAGKTVVVK
jgi:hypothetical protein